MATWKSDMDFSSGRQNENCVIIKLRAHSWESALPYTICFVHSVNQYVYLHKIRLLLFIDFNYSIQQSAIHTRDSGWQRQCAIVWNVCAESLLFFSTDVFLVFFHLISILNQFVVVLLQNWYWPTKRMSSNSGCCTFSCGPNKSRKFTATHEYTILFVFNN